MKLLGATLRVLVLAALLAGYAAALLYAPVRAQVARPDDLTRSERALALLLGRVTFNEGADSEPDGELVAQVVLGHGETADARLHWLTRHSRCVSGVLTQDEAYRRGGNCRWSRNLHPDGRRPRGWDRLRDGHWTRTRDRWRIVLERAVEYVRGDRPATICAEQPLSWDGTRYGADRVAPAGTQRRILDCREPYVVGPAQRGLHNFAVTWRPAGPDGAARGDGPRSAASVASGGAS